VGVSRKNAIEQMSGVAFWEGKDTEAEVEDVYPAALVQVPSVAHSRR
jgi:hypothetical protein